jgi:hypothetical protein
MFDILGAVKEGTGLLRGILDKVIPDAKDRLEAEQAIGKMEHALQLSQIEINRKEAESSSLFVSGWRPAVGWVCVLSMLYAVVLNDLLNWVLAVAAMFTEKPLPALPEADMTLTFDLLLALLGIGGLRTYEKLKGISHIKPKG